MGQIGQPNPFDTSIVTHLEIIRLIISLVTQNNKNIFQMDLKSTFLNEHGEAVIVNLSCK